MHSLDGGIALAKDGAPTKIVGKSARVYSPKTLKILFSLSGNQCAYPECTQRLVIDATEESGTFVVGKICHIHSASDGGPRANPQLNPRERDAPENLILLCPTHHDIVDGQWETYPSGTLVEWKERRERGQRATFTATINDLGYFELEAAARALLNSAPAAAGSLLAIPPDKKIEKNGLSRSSAMYISLGGAKSEEVAQTIVRACQLEPNFETNLKSGFVKKYSELKKTYLGDELFFELWQWAAGGPMATPRAMAGLCILTHLFIICDVFEK